MGENAQFRTASFGGFHRQDVINYIERTAKENQARQTELEEQLKATQTELEEKTKELNETAEKLARAETALEQVREHMTAMKEDLANQQAAFEQEKQGFAEIELSARRRAAQVEENAKTEAEQTMAAAKEQAEQLLQQAQHDADRQIGDLHQEIDQLQEKRRTLLKEARSELNKNATALKASVSISLEEIERLRQTLEELSGSFDGSISALDTVCTEEA